MKTVAELRKERAVAFTAFEALVAKDTLTADEEADYVVQRTAVENFDKHIDRALAAERLSARGALPVDGQERVATVPARAETDPYINNDVASRARLRPRKRVSSSAA